MEEGGAGQGAAEAIRARRARARAARGIAGLAMMVAVGVLARRLTRGEAGAGGGVEENVHADEQQQMRAELMKAVLFAAALDD